MLIGKLTNIASSLSGSDLTNIEKQISNWQTVLRNYRAHNDDLTQIFSADNNLFMAMLKSYQQFASSGISESDFVAAFDSFLTNFDPSALSQAQSLFSSTFNQLGSVCSVAVDQSTNNYVKSACSDFSASKKDYSDIYDFLSSACDMPATPDGGANNPLQNSVIMQNLCKKSSSVASANNIPGGLADSDSSDELMGFLKRNTKYITFSSNAPTVLSWTSTVSDSLSVDASAEGSEDQGDDYSSHTGLDTFGVTVSNAMSTGTGKGLGLSVGKSSGSSHEYSRTVSIILADNDIGWLLHKIILKSISFQFHQIGDYFAVRITEDPVFGTPVFTTMGGQSRCPGESGTNRRESQVRIVDIIPRCPSSSGDCTNINLNPGEKAHFGVVIINESPTGSVFAYNLHSLF